MNRLRIVGKTILEQFPCRIFSLDQVVRSAKIDRKQARDIMHIFCKEGLIRIVSKRQRAEKEYGDPISFVITYRITDRKKLAARIAPRQYENTTQDKMWFIIRKRRIFTLRELIVLSGARRQTVRHYLKALRSLGVIERSRSGGGPGVYWTLIKDPGAKRPHIGRKK